MLFEFIGNCDYFNLLYIERLEIRDVNIFFTVNIE